MFLIGPKRAYGIRDVDDEYNDAADIVALSTTSPVAAHVNRLLEISERRRLLLSESAAIAKAEAVKEAERQEIEKWEERRKASWDQLQEKWNEFNRKNGKRAEKAFQEVEELRRRQQLESDLLDKAFVSEAEAQELDKRRKMIELEQLERKRLEDERRRLQAEENLEKEKVLIELQAKQKEEEKAERLSQLKAEEEKKAQEGARLALMTIASSSTSKESLVPPEFRGCIFYNDLLKYSKSQDLLDRVQEQTKHITKTSKFYNGAIKVVNSPLNQISSQTHSKVTHFTDLLEGKSVHVAGLATSFSTTQERNGDLFVKNLLAFRFVKKAEAESSENKMKRENLNYLATVGVALVKRFPDVEELIQAHFYKICPFLVPFSYPRNGMDILAYGAALGHQISIGDENTESLEASITQTLLDRLSGYCMLYGFMVRNMSSEPSTGKQPNSFLFPVEVLAILAKILSLDPQEEVTATILHGLLEILHDLLSRCYGRQYKKLLRYMKAVYIGRIRKATSKGKSASLARLELLLEKLLR